MRSRDGEGSGKVLDVVPGIGWDAIKLGDTAEEIRRGLAASGLTYDASIDPLCWELEDPCLRLQFVANPSPRLAHIIFYSTEAQINGAALVDLALDEALLCLGVRSFEDTLWSNVDIDSEYRHGARISDSQRSKKAKQEELLVGGTLWVKSMGIGLSVVYGHVDAFILGRPEDVPRVGCGPLSQETIVAIGDAGYRKKLTSTPVTEPKIGGKPLGAIARAALGRLALIAVALLLLVVPAFIMISKYQRWQAATPVQGAVIEVQSEGPFVISLTVEYPKPDGTKGKASVNANTTIAREVGEEVELFYLPEDPDRVLTRSEARSVAFDGYWPYALVTGPAVAIGLLAFAFPRKPATVR